MTLLQVSALSQPGAAACAAVHLERLLGEKLAPRRNKCRSAVAALIGEGRAWRRYAIADGSKRQGRPSEETRTLAYFASSLLLADVRIGITGTTIEISLS